MVNLFHQKGLNFIVENKIAITAKFNLYFIIMAIKPKLFAIKVIIIMYVIVIKGFINFTIIN